MITPNDSMGAERSCGGHPGSRLWMVAELGEETRYIRSDVITEVARRKLAAGRYGIEDTLACGSCPTSTPRPPPRCS